MKMKKSVSMMLALLAAFALIAASCGDDDNEVTVEPAAPAAAEPAAEEPAAEEPVAA